MHVPRAGAGSWPGGWHVRRSRAQRFHRLRCCRCVNWGPGGELAWRMARQAVPRSAVPSVAMLQMHQLRTGRCFASPGGLVIEGYSVRVDMRVG